MGDCPIARGATVYADVIDKRELDSRVSDGIHVRLVWFRRGNRVAVEVDDAKTGDAFTVHVGAQERALDVFHHPYAYAALRVAA
jgi:hypothetical protein